MIESDDYLSIADKLTPGDVKKGLEKGRKLQGRLRDLFRARTLLTNRQAEALRIALQLAKAESLRFFVIPKGIGVREHTSFQAGGRRPLTTIYVAAPSNGHQHNADEIKIIIDMLAVNTPPVVQAIGLTKIVPSPQP